MIALVRGRLVARDLDRAVVMTDGGIGYELAIPLGVYELLPKPGEEVTLHTHLVVREDQWLLFGFATVGERRLFERLLTANGVGPALALAMLSHLSAERLVRAIRDKDLTTLQGVPRVGRKKAERMILDLADKLDDVLTEGTAGAGGRPAGASAGAEDAIRALVSLGYSTADAEKAVRTAIDAGGRGLSVPEIIRGALASMGGR
ncbi:MAG: Holliday junction branch migration protein RuvA [Gemmatimonadaceae bacterium]